MDAVKSFNLELSGLYEVRPPISKAKMTSITKGAIKAIKFYKHVVQSVEKFILKCKPEYKVPGLYVIDSIVRQSRHQFGAERDVFAPRFAKNMQQTFINLFSCPQEEKSKVIRVLNLWQKNQVFPPEVIQPLFDLADPNNPLFKEQNLNQSNGVGNQSVGALVKGSPAIQRSPAKGGQVSHGDSHSGVQNNLPDANTLAQLHQLHKTLQKQSADVGKLEGQAVRFDRKLLDFDYDDEEDDDHVNPSPNIHPHNTASAAMDTVGSLLSNPEVLRQLQTLQQTISQSQYQEIDLEKLRKLQEMKQQEEEFDKHLAQTVPNLPFASECELKPMNPPPHAAQPYYMTGIQDLGIPPPGYKQMHGIYEMPVQEMRPNEPAFPKEVPDVEIINLDQTDSRSPTPIGDRYTSRRRRSRSRERSRDRGRGKDRERRAKRSRSRSHSRDRRRRSRSRERNRDRDREREREKDKERDREKERERRKRGLPPLKKEHLCVCSTTLWVGHLSKLVHQEELSDAFGEYGGIVSIDLIPPRGCAFIVMHRRQDAARCLEKLKNHKLQGKAITLAWAPGKGLKGKDLKDYWEVDLGVSYIPWPKIKPDIDVELLEDGGMIDEDSMPAWLKTKIAQSASAVITSPHVPLMGIPGLATPAIPSLANLDTSQPPPMQTATLLQPPPSLPLQMVNPFQISLGMGMPPSIMANVPIGVPPPNITQATIMSNPLLGFAQGPTPGLLPPPISLPNPANPPPIPKPMAPFPILQMPSHYHDDNMDIEMEDVDKVSKPPPLSDQLLASLSVTNDQSSLNAALSRLNAVAGGKVEENIGESSLENLTKDDNKEVRFGNDRKRESYEKRESHEHRDRADYRRERSNRWGDRADNEHEGRNNRRSQNLNDRLKEMTGQELLTNEKSHSKNVEFVPPPAHEEGDVFATRFNNDNDRNEDITAFTNPEPPMETSFSGGDDPKLQDFARNNDWQLNQGDNYGNHNRSNSGLWENSLERNNFNSHEQNFNAFQGPGFDGNSHRGLHIRKEIFIKEDGFFERNKEHQGPYEKGPSSDFGPRNDSIMDSEYGGEEGYEQGDQGFGEADNEDQMYNDHGPPFGGPDHGRPGYGGPDHGRHGFGGPGFGGPDFHGGRGFRGRDNRRGFGTPDRGKRGGGPFGNGPRPDFWPPRNMRGGDGFRSRGRAGPFPPRGQQGRGLRHFGPRWNEGGDRSFQPRFDGPPDYFRGPKFDEPPRRSYDDSRSRSSRRDREDRRHYRRDSEEERPPREKRSRWGGSSPKETETGPENNSLEANTESVSTEEPNVEPTSVEDISETNQSNYDAGNSTPLHDEPQEPEVPGELPEPTQESEPTTDTAIEDEQ